MTDWLPIISLFLNVVVLPLGYVIFRMLDGIRQNDLKHLDEQFSEIKDGQNRIEQKIDRHLEWHSAN